MILQFADAAGAAGFLARLVKDEPALAALAKPSYTQPAVVLVRTEDAALQARVRALADGAARTWEDHAFTTTAR